MLNRVVRFTTGQAWDGVVSSFICTAINEVDSSLLLYGLSGSEMKNSSRCI